MKKKLKEIPEFKNEDEEREFWWTHDSTDYLDWDNAESVTFPNLKPTVRKKTTKESPNCGGSKRD